MRTRTGWLAVLLVAGMASIGRAQPLDYDVPRDPHPFPLPLYHDRPETGGLFVAGEFLYWRQDNTLGHQVIAEYAAVGSGQTAISADFLDKETYVPGWHLAIGYRLRNGIVAQVDWYHLHDANVTSGATLVQAGTTPLVVNFLFSPVYNWPVDFIGEEADGIWQQADDMTVKYTQRFDRWDLAFRVPICESECSRTYGLTGFTHIWLWERFKWRTVDRIALTGLAVEQDVAEYSNILSQPMYGLYCGCGQECFFGQDCKSFGFTCDLRGAMYVDFARNLVTYERADRAIGSKRNRREYQTVGSAEAQLNLWWYPIEGVVMRVGWDAMVLFNTVYIPNPVDFNFLGLSPDWQHRSYRLIDGLNLGVGFIF